MEKIIIDTNILYSWVSVFPNEKLTPDQIRELSIRNELYFTTASIAEVVVKFRNNLDIIKRCFAPLITESLKIINIGFLPVESEVIKKIYHSNSINKIENEVQNIFETKLTKEAEFLRFFLIAMLFGIFHGIREYEGYKLEDIKLDNAFLLSTRALIEGNTEFIFETLKIELLKGYSSNQEQQTIRDTFAEWILRMINIWVLNFYLAKHGVLLGNLQNPDSEKMSKVEEDLKNDPLQRKIIRNLDNPFKIISRSSIHTFTDGYINELNKELAKHGLITKETREYILVKIEKALKENAKFRKNDVLDLLILYSLNLEGFKFITFDAKLISALQSIDKKSFDYIKALGIG